MIHKKALITNYPSSPEDFRLQIIKHYLENAGVEVITISNAFWGNYKTKTKYSKNLFSAILNSYKFISYYCLVFKTIRKNQFDIILIGHPPIIDFFIIKLFSKKSILSKVYIDFFISLFDTLILDRKKFRKKSLMARLFFKMDKFLLKKASCIITDTDQNTHRYIKLFDCPSQNFKRIMVGSKMLISENIDIFNANRFKDNNNVKIGWVGAFINLHGFQKIIDTAALLKGKSFEFHIIGNGPNNELKYYRELTLQLGLNNLTFYNELNYKESMLILNNCNICLGVFGESEKTKSVIPFKIFDYLCLDKTIITQESNALSELGFQDNIIQVEGDSTSIARAILDFKEPEPAANNNSRKIDKLICGDIKSAFLYNE